MGKEFKSGEKGDYKQRVHIMTDGEGLAGKYANMSQLTFTKEEFILDAFVVVLPRGKLATRLIVSPKHAKRLKDMFNEMVDRYEKEHGNIIDWEDGIGDITENPDLDHNH